MKWKKGASVELKERNLAVIEFLKTNSFREAQKEFGISLARLTQIKSRYVKDKKKATE